MAQDVVATVLAVACVYLIAGAAFTILFQVRGLNRVDGAVHGSSIWFRVIIIPGCVLLWPVLLRKWIRAAG